MFRLLRWVLIAVVVVVLIGFGWVQITRSQQIDALRADLAAVKQDNKQMVDYLTHLVKMKSPTSLKAAKEDWQQVIKLANIDPSQVYNDLKPVATDCGKHLGSYNLRSHALGETRVLGAKLPYVLPVATDTSTTCNPF